MHASVDLTTGLAPDRATCEACLAELRDPAGRRHRHAFVSCPACGPGYSAAPHLFPRCEQCEAEYADPAGRRGGYPATCCPGCGPRLRLLVPTQPPRHGEDALAEARAVLSGGGVLAVKTVGGYRLVCDATDGDAVAMLRKRLQRGDEPFAALVRGLDEAQQLVQLGPAEAALLSGPARPVVLAVRRRGALARAVAPGRRDLGVMLAAEPLHHLLLGLPGDPPGPAALVVVAAGPPARPVVTDDDEALTLLGGIADAWLGHDGRIGAPSDDSVVRAVEGGSAPVRVARGLEPVRLRLPFDTQPTLALGGDAGAFCLAGGRVAWLCGPLGDLGEPATQQALHDAVSRMTRLTGIAPRVVATDRDPAYPSWQWARDRFDVDDVVEVGHPHAHVAATMAEHGVPDGRSVIGVVLDDGGRGDDGAWWGGEVVVADYRECERAAHLGYVDLPRSRLAHQPRTVALAHLRSAGVPWDPSLPSVRACDDAELGSLDLQLGDAQQCEATSSMVRLYEAVASLTGVCHRTDHPGQAVSELESRARPFGLGDLGRRTRVYAFGDDGDPTPVIWSVVQDVRKGVDAGLVAARFQQAVVDHVVATVRRVHERTHVPTVTLSGGLFVHPFLTSACLERLSAQRFEVLTHRRVPAGEGGLALGQVALLAHRE